MTEQTLLSVHPRYLISRIADSATMLNDLQDKNAGGDSFSIAMGYPEKYAIPFNKGGKPLNRAELNNVFNLLSQLHFYWQMGGVPVWNRDIANGAGNYSGIKGYPHNARVFKMIGSRMEEFLSRKDNNSVEPTLSSTEDWMRVTLGAEAATKEYVDTKIETLSGNSKITDENLKALIDAGDENLQQMVVTLSGNALSADARIASSVGTVSSNLNELSGVVSSISTSGSVSELSANALSRDNALASSISSLSSNTSNSITTLSQSIATLSGNASSVDASIASSLNVVSSDVHELSGVVSSLASSGAIGELSSNAKKRDDSLASSIETLASSITGLSDAIGSLSADAKNRDDALASSISTLSSRSSDTESSVSELSGMVGTISGYAKDADERIARSNEQKLERSAVVTELTESSLDTTVPGTLAVYQFVNSSIVNLAAYFLTKNANGDAFATKAELNVAIASGTFYNGGVKRTPQKNDYCIVQADEDHQSAQGGGLTTRYIYDGSKWVFQYALNNSSFSESQLAAINSKMTEAIHGTITSNIQTLSGYTQTLSAYSLTSHTHSIYATTATVNSIQEAVSEHATSIGTISSDVDAIKTTVSGHTTSINSLNTTVTNLGSSLGAVSASLESVSASLNSVSASFMSVSSSVTGMSGRIDTVSGRVGSLADEISGINGTLSTFGSVISAISSSLNTLQDTVDGLSAVYLKIVDMKAFDQWS